MWLELFGSRVPMTGRRIIIFGLILLVGAAFRGAAVSVIAPELNTAVPPDAWSSMDEAARLAGFLLVTLGLLILGRFAYDQASTRRLEEALGQAAQQLDSTRGMLDGLLKSDLTTTGTAVPVRDSAGQVRDFQLRLSPFDTQRWFPGRSESSTSLLTADQSIPIAWLFGLFKKVVETGESAADAHREATVGGAVWYETAAVKHGESVCFTFANVTGRKSLEDQMHKAARTDALTGLPNRAWFNERLAAVLEDCRIGTSQRFAVMFLDFDRFKNINDTLGHDVGDQLLISIADRLKGSLRAMGATGPESHMAARLGGDEFVVLLSGVMREQEAVIVAERLGAELAKPHRISGHEIVSTASIGITIGDKRYTRTSDVLRDADLALYSAKSAGRARHVLFEQGMQERAVKRARLENELRDAISHERFYLEYQPIISFQKGAVVGFESLIRWSHPQRGPVAPGEFIPLAEETGLITKIGPWVIDQACRALPSLLDKQSDLFITINQSKREMLSPKLVVDVERTLGETGIDPQKLLIEMTESVCVSCQSEILPVLRALKKLGVRLGIDDFGTGQSSYATLHELPVDILKLDSSFLSSTRSRRASAAILQSMIEMAHNLNIPVIVEGVETKEDLALLQSVGCDLGQGWLFGESTPLDQAIARLDDMDRRLRLAA